MSVQEHSKGHTVFCCKGLTLLEITFAFAIFAVVLGAAAQSLVYLYGVIALQQQRASALNDCAAVLAAMRQTAYRGEASEACPETNPLFPCILVDWAEQFPATFEAASDDDDLLERYGAFFSLPEQQFIVEVTDAGGNPATISPVLNLNTNPVFVTVTSTWTGIRGITNTVRMSTVLTDR